jgi:transposase
VIEREGLPAEARPAELDAKAFEASATFVPLPLPVDRPPLADIRVQVQRFGTTVTITWPVAAATDLAHCLREWLR